MSQTFHLLSLVFLLFILSVSALAPPDPNAAPFILPVPVRPARPQRWVRPHPTLLFPHPTLSQPNSIATLTPTNSPFPLNSTDPTTAPVNYRPNMPPPAQRDQTTS